MASSNKTCDVTLAPLPVPANPDQSAVPRGVMLALAVPSAALPMKTCTMPRVLLTAQHLASLCTTISTKKAREFDCENCGCCKQHMMHRSGPAFLMKCCGVIIHGRCMLQNVADRREKQFICMICPSCATHISCF